MAKKVTAKRIHVPLDEDLYRRLRAEAERTGRPTTKIAREAIDRFLTEMHKNVVHEAIASYAAACAGTTADLDPELEAAAAEYLRDGDEGGYAGREQERGKATARKRRRRRGAASG